MQALTPLPVALPLAIAAVLLIVGHILPRNGADIIAMLTAAAAGLIAVLLAMAASEAPFAYWFGGWQPRDGVAIGIAFVVDPAGAGCAAFAALLFFASFIFSWGYFDEVHARYHALMLIFQGALAGFAMTGDLFNFFVFFELMSTVAFALTGYRLESSALEGALNFTVTNAVGSFMMLAGIGTLYGRTGALNFAQLGRALAGLPPDGLLALAVALIFGALFIKGAIVPFHFWIADAHSVAPSPVCAIFSGIMVPIALFGAARLYWSVFAGSGLDQAPLRPLLVWFGTATALVGGFTAFMQRDVKRLLAMSTVSHMGVLLVGIGLLSSEALAGAMLYLLGHGLAKAGLFLIGGILLSQCAGIDEIKLRGAGKEFPVTGAFYALGGLIMAGLPVGLEHQGDHLIDEAISATGLAFLPPLLSIANGLTGAGILRGAGRIFLGLGPEPGEEALSPTEEEREKQDRPVWLMLLPVVALIGTALALQAVPAEEAARQAAAMFAATGDLAAAVLDQAAWQPVAAAPEPSSASPIEPAIGLAVAIGLAAFELGRDHLPRRLVRAADRATAPLFIGLDRLHDGVVGDYVAWTVFGAIALGVVIAIG
ncbi:MAG TPA: proton-conducting transporter membrane subunit [Stellaceae bacterium]|nr:proton-conducting transporter membrane subunit [Stellaceae bacterium]